MLRVYKERIKDDPTNLDLESIISILHSVVIAGHFYENFNSSVLTDEQYDEYSKILVNYIKNYTDKSLQVPFKNTLTYFEVNVEDINADSGQWTTKVPIHKVLQNVFRYGTYTMCVQELDVQELNHVFTKNFRILGLNGKESKGKITKNGIKLSVK